VSLYTEGLGAFICPPSKLNSLYPANQKTKKQKTHSIQTQPQLSKSKWVRLQGARKDPKSRSSTWRRRCRPEPVRGSGYWNSDPSWCAPGSWWSLRTTPPWSDPPISRSSPPCPCAATASPATPLFPPRPSARSPIGSTTFSKVGHPLLVAEKIEEKEGKFGFLRTHFFGYSYNDFVFLGIFVSFLF
jgi:hypothetical protein